MFVPKLLMPELGCRGSIPEPESAHVLGQEQVEQSECYTVVGLCGGITVRLSIDYDSFLARRKVEAHVHTAASRERRRLDVVKTLNELAADDPKRAILERTIAHSAGIPAPEFTSHSTTIWKPKINAEIDSSMFDFTPPTG